MDPHFLTGLIGLFALVALIAIRVPIAHAMLIVGASGIAILSGPGILLSQLKTLVYVADGKSFLKGTGAAVRYAASFVAAPIWPPSKAAS